MAGTLVGGLQQMDRAVALVPSEATRDRPRLLLDRFAGPTMKEYPRAEIGRFLARRRGL